MHTSIKSVTILLLLVLISSPLDAQYRRGGWNQFKEGLSITPRAGYNMFFGDLVDKSRGSFSLGVLAEKELSTAFSARAQLIGGHMQGTQIMPVANTAYANFENIYSELTFGASYRPLNSLLGYFKQRQFQPYIHLNTGLIYYNATEYWGPASGNPAGDVWRKASEIAPLVSAGGGTSIWLSPSLSVNLELTGTLPFSDKLDVHDEWYDNQGGVHTTDPFDFYYTFTAGITFLLKDSRFRNDPKYNRRSYLRMRSYYKYKSRKRSSGIPKRKRR